MAGTRVTYTAVTESRFLHVQTVRPTLKAATWGFLKNCQERGTGLGANGRPEPARWGAPTTAHRAGKCCGGNPACRQEGETAVDVNT